jgi:hypothetical protein
VILAQNHIGAANIFPVSQEKSVISGEITVDGRKGRPYAVFWGAVVADGGQRNFKSSAIADTTILNSQFSIGNLKRFPGHLRYPGKYFYSVVSAGGGASVTMMFAMP